MSGHLHFMGHKSSHNISNGYGGVIGVAVPVLLPVPLLNNTYL